MKTFFLSLLLTGTMFSYSQTTYNLDKKTDSISYTLTKDVAIYHGEKLPVYISKTGKLFIIVTSKKGNKYKKYIK